MSRKVLKKSRTGQWVVIALALLAVGVAAASALPNSQKTTVSNSGASSIESSSSEKAKTAETTKPAAEAKSKAKADKAKADKATKSDTNAINNGVRRAVEEAVASLAPVSPSQVSEVDVPVVSAKLSEAPNVKDILAGDTRSYQEPLAPITSSRPATATVKDILPTVSDKDKEPLAPVTDAEPSKPAKPAETNITAKPAVPSTPAKPTTPVAPSKPVETPQPPKDTTTVVSKDVVEKPLPKPEVKPGGEVIKSETTDTSSSTVTGEKPATPVDIPALPADTNTTVTPGNEVVTKPEVPATPSVPATEEVVDKDGNVVTPAKPEVPGTPAQPAETVRVDVLTETTTIAYGTSYVKDTTLKSGETKVLTAGVNGAIVTTFNVTYTNGVETGREVASTNRTEPVNEVIAYNDEPETLKEEVVKTTNTIAYGTERRATTELKEGEERVIVKGVNGTTETTTKNVYDAGGNLVSTEDLGTVTIAEPVTEVIEYGVKAQDVVEVVEERTSEELNYSTETRETDALYKGETRVVTQGVKGYVVKVAKITKTNGVETAREVTDGERVEPVTEVVEVGTKDRVETTSETVTEAIDFTTETRENDQLDKGETRVITQGVKGERVIKRTTTVTNGGTPVVTDEVVSETQPVNEVVEIGTREKVETSTREVVEELNFETVVRNNPNLKKGERKVVVKGEKGRKVTRITATNVAGVIVEHSDVIETVDPVTEIIEVGTKEDIRYEMRVEREELDFATETRETDALFEGETREAVAGVKGKKATTYKDTYVDGVKVGTEVVGEPVVVAPVNRVIEIGTRKEKTSASVTNTEVVHYSTVTENDPNLEVGQTRIKVNGVNGERVVRITRVTDNRTGKVTETSEVISETPAVNEVLVVGTKPVIDDNDITNKKFLTVDEFLTLTEEQQDAFLAKPGNSVPGTYIYMNQGADQATLDKVEQIINIEKLNLEFVRLLNEARAAEGRKPVSYAGKDSLAQKAATTRANEMADHGSLRYQGLESGVHKRPDGSGWSTIYTDAERSSMTWRAENAVQLGASLSARSAANEAKVAEKLFSQWIKSPSHKAAMMKRLDNIQVAVGVGLGAKSIEPVFSSGVTIGILELVQFN
ncbi:G5 domain-containing protein [Streptococcus pneumoniae]